MTTAGGTGGSTASSGTGEHAADASVRTARAAAAVLARASRDGERVIASARIILAIVTLIAWPAWNSQRMLEEHVVADWVVEGMSAASLLFSIGVLWWLRGERPERMTTSLRTISILVDAVLIVGGLATFIVNPPPEYQGIAREPGSSFAFFGVLAGGVRLRRSSVILAALTFGVGLLGLLVADHAMNPSAPVGPPNVLTIGGLWLTAAVFAWRFATRTERHVLEGADNAADEINKLYTRLKERVKERSAELSSMLSMLARRRHTAEGSLKSGDLIDERYAIERLIGSGGMGSVYAAVDKWTGDRVAIKVIQATSANHLDALRRFLGEARIAAEISHHAVVQMIHVGMSQDGLFFQVQELIDGVTLEKRVAVGPLGAGVVARVGEVLCGALAAVHGRGLIHRDVKPTNVMLTKTQPGLKLVDFGIAKELDTDATETGKVVGTPAYMAPEQIRAEHVKTAADVYAVGVTLVRCLTQKLPSSGGLTMLDAAVAASTQTPAPPHACPPELADLIRSCIRDNADDRPPAAQAADMLARIAKKLGAPELVDAELWIAVPTSSPAHLSPPPNASPDGASRSSPSGDAARNAAGDAPGTFTQELAALADNGGALASALIGARALRFAGHALVEALSPADSTAGLRGTVWRAVDEKSRRSVALRVLARDCPDDDKQRFLDAQRAALPVWHPNVCGIFDVGEEDGAPYVATELVHGETLASVLGAANDNGFDRSRARFIALEIARGLEAIHAAGLSYGALRAENVKIDGNAVKLLDVGMPRAAAAPNGNGAGHADDARALATLLRQMGLSSATPAAGAPAQTVKDVVAHLLNAA